MNARLRALNRFGLGARIGQARTLDDPVGWLRGQLDGPPPTLDDRGLPDLAEAGELLGRLRAAQQAGDAEAVRGVLGDVRGVMAAEMQAMLRERITTERPFVERLVAFWSNHLCVSVAGEAAVQPLAGHYERTVVRPHVLGRFEDMVLASARHPAMLVYLDNARSVGPGSPAARIASRRRGRDVGLNENYARELLELHTLGVDGGYDQRDVEALARVLTGWGVAGVGPGERAGGAVGFLFRAAVHEPGPKTVLGRRYGPSGQDEGEAAIRDLCRHPSTATFLATKLVRHFVSDDPPTAAVEAVAAAFRTSRGDLKAVARAVVDLDGAWAPEHRKFRTPQDWLVALLRAVHARAAPEVAPGVLRELRHTPWAPGAPKGYGDTAREWADPDGLMNRAELARSVARRMDADALDPRRLLDVVDVAPDDPLHTLMADDSIDAEERLALAVGGPAFQWR